MDDEQLLAATSRDPRAFGEFYARHERAVFRYFYRRVRDAELAADLSAECFAAALLGASRFRGGDAPAVAWLFGIARNLLRRSAEKRRVESKARARLGMGPLVLEDDTLAALERRDLVTRAGDPADGRRVVLSVTDAGKRLLMDRASASAQRMGGALAEGFTPAELRLLGPYDPLTELADRELLVPGGAQRKQVWAAVANPGVVLHDGEIVATWRRRGARGRLTLTVTPFGALPPGWADTEGARADADIVARFFGAEEVRVETAG